MNEVLTQVMETVERISEDSTTRMLLVEAITGKIASLESRVELDAIKDGAGVPQSSIAGYRSTVFDAPWIKRTLCVECGRSKVIIALVDTDGTEDSAYPFTRQDNWAYQYGEQCDFCDAPISSMQPQWQLDKAAEANHLPTCAYGTADYGDCCCGEAIDAMKEVR